MERQVTLIAPSPQLGAGSTIDMDLPPDRLQRLVIVKIADGDPRQPVAAMNAARLSLAQGATAIIDDDLRHGPEQEFTEDLEFCQGREHRRHGARANDVGDLSLGRCNSEYAVRGVDQSTGESDTLGVIAVQQRVGCATRKNRLNFPREIDRIPDAGVHSLPAS